MIKKRIISFTWLLVGFATIALLFIGASSKSDKKCSDINVEVTVKAQQVFIDVQGIRRQIAEAGGKPGTPLAQINLSVIEKRLRKNPWIKDIKLFFDSDQVLQAKLEESDPVARIFTESGKTFYIDSNANHLPMNSNIVARIPVFTGFPSDKIVLSKPDSAILLDIKEMANFLISSDFWNDFTSQVNYEPATGLTILPAIGSQKIIIGNAENLQQKFNRLYSFYRQVIVRTGLAAYDQIDVQYAGQVVATRASNKHNAHAGTLARASTAVQKPPPAKTSVLKKQPSTKKKTTKNK